MKHHPHAMNAHFHVPASSVSLNKGLPLLAHETRCHSSSGGAPRGLFNPWRERLAVLGFSLLFIGGAAVLLLLNSEKDTFVYVITGVSGWMGLSFLFIAFFMRESHQAVEEEAFWFYSGGAPEMRPVVDGLQRHTQRVRSKASLLFIAESGQWRFKAGYNCSPGVGAAVAQSLKSLMGSSQQQVLPLQVVDGTMNAVCTPFSLTSGFELLLVSLHDVQASLKAGVVKDSCHTAVEFGWLLGWSFSKASANTFRGASFGTSPSPTCCAVCDRVQAVSGGWLRWDAWLHERERTALSHTICPECSEWAYPGTSGQPVSHSSRIPV